MSDTEIMTAIGWDTQFEEEPPTMIKSKKSFIQKLTERHEALKLHIRSPKLDDLDQDDQRAPSRGSSSSSVQKDFFKILPAVWSTKSERPIAMRYDDIADDSQPSPVFVKSPVTTPTELDCKIEEQKTFARIRRHDRRESSVMEMNATHRLYTSHSIASLGSACASPRTSIKFSPPKARSRSLPSQMSDEQIDAWLDSPEDAELHRQRKLAQSESLYNSSTRFTQRRKPVPVAIQSPVVFRRDNPFVCDRGAAEARPLMVSPTSSSINVALAGQHLRCMSLATMPVEVVLGIARYLDSESVLAWRQTCKKFSGTLPAPLKPLTLNKT
jgi:hypothetical protein